MLNVEYRKVETLIPYARNPRTHTDEQVAKIAASIVEYGWTNPILVDGENGIIAGHGRLAAARKLSGKTLDLAGSAQTVAGWLKEKIPGVDWNGLTLRNGSGLTKDSRISPEQMVAVLRYAQKLSFGNQIYADLLRRYNVGKVESEEEYGHEEGAPQNNRERGAKRGVDIKAKTGTVNYSRGVVGYLHTGKGRDVVFAVFISDYKQREAMQKQGQAWKEPPVRWWLSRSREFQRTLVKRWAEKL